MIRRPPCSTRTYPLSPDTPLVRSLGRLPGGAPTASRRDGRLSRDRWWPGEGRVTGLTTRVAIVVVRGSPGSRWRPAAVNPRRRTGPAVRYPDGRALIAGVGGARLDMPSMTAGEAEPNGQASGRERMGQAGEV